MIERRGWYLESPLYPPAHLGLARAPRRSAARGQESRQAYEAFFAEWKDADGELLILIEVREEDARATAQ